MNDDIKELEIDELKKIKGQQQVVEWAVNWFRQQSLWVLSYGTGCGAIEVPPTMTARYDAERLGIRGAATPRQADVLIISGYLSYKTLKRVIRTYEQMQSPKYIIGLGSCTMNGGMYWDSYNTAKQLDQYLPFDIFVAGCMPRPEALIDGFMELKKQISKGESDGAKRYEENIDWYKANQKKVFGDKMTPTYTCDWYYGDGGIL
ncbi:MAG: NADH-quinone oxidoreductase subunit B [Spirochaetaceae bacterium 4572_7]|nr:MAG: NADH-quinone oxidoreductase subunit B [Spirochaetaceae bacterium 4572_7]